MTLVKLNKTILFSGALVGVFLLAALLRFFQLGHIPFGLTNDEAGYIYNAYSIWLTGEDIQGKFFPLSFNVITSYCPIPVYLIAPFIGLFGLSLTVARFPYALASLGSVIFLFLIVRHLFKHNVLALICAFVLTVSPWHLHISRVAYEGVFALFFILVGMYVFIRNSKKGNILWSLPFFFLAFHSYHAIKVFLIFFIPFLLFLYRDELAKHKRQLILFLLGFVGILLSFYVVLKVQGVTRQQVFIWNDTQAAVDQVHFDREKNTSPEFLKVVMSNKPLYYLRVIRENYLHAFSTDYLFLYGDTLAIYSPFFRGELYFFEVIFLIWGIVFLVRRKDKKITYLMLGGLLLAPLPSTFTVDRNYVVRSIMMLPFLAVLVGCGIYACSVFLTRYRKVIHYSAVLLLAIVYFIFLSSYLYQYYYRYNVYSAEVWFKSHTDVIRYINDHQNEYSRVIITMPTREFLLQYAIINQVDPRKMQNLWRGENNARLGKVQFIEECLKKGEAIFNPATELTENTLYISDGRCHTKSREKTTIVDAGNQTDIKWRVFENK